VGSKSDSRHLTSQQIQEFLDRQLPPGEGARVQEHLSACSRCHSEAEAWRVLFADLAELPEMAPGPAFSREILDRAPVGHPAIHGIRGWLAARQGSREEIHIPSSSIQDYLEGLLSDQPAARVKAHLASCSSCRREVQGWEGLLNAMGPLPRFSPSTGFAERVMAKVMVPSTAPARTRVAPSLSGRALAWIRGMLPRTRQGWAVAGGVASAPTITLLALAYLIFSRPLVTVGNLGAYLWWKGSTLLAQAVSSVSALVLESDTLFRVYSFFEPMVRSPYLLSLGGVVLSLLSAGALWVLYRNLISNQSDGSHARASS